MITESLKNVNYTDRPISSIILSENSKLKKIKHLTFFK